MKKPYQAIASLLLAASVRAVAVATPAQGAPETGAVLAPAEDALLAELQQVTVTSVSRRPERLQDVAAAAFVISAEDIARSGAQSVPEALRLAPGVEVAQLAGGRWAVSVRGFNGRFANQLLVLVDGRSIYTPLFSGVYWEGLNLPMAEIERIEVVRGPGAALWGANAVNGVINILTRRARDTEGSRVAAVAATREQSRLALQHTAALDADTRLRAWAQTRSSAVSVNVHGADTDDNPRDNSAGFRIDRQLGAQAGLQLTGGASAHRSADTYPLPVIANGQAASLQNRENLTQIYLQAQLDLQRSATQTDTARVSLSHDRLENTGILTESRLTLDLALQTERSVGAAQQVLAGLDYRLSRDNIDTPSTLLQVAPRRDQLQQVGLFLRDQIVLEPGRWQLGLGVRFEGNTYVSPQVQPDLRLQFTPSSTTTLWTALSSATRTPARGERDGTLDLGTLPADAGGNLGVVPVHLISTPNRGLDVEIQQSLELGLRQQVASNFGLDVSLFTHRYDNLLQSQLGSLVVGASNGMPTFTYLVPRSTSMRARIDGAEAALDWQAGPDTRLALALTELRVHADTGSDVLTQAQAAALEGNAAQHRVSLRVSHDPVPGQHLDGWLRRASGLQAQGVPAYVTLDLRYGLAWSRSLALSVFGQNLLAPRHPEFTTELITERNVAVPRVFGVSADWRL